MGTQNLGIWRGEVSGSGWSQEGKYCRILGEVGKRPQHPSPAATWHFQGWPWELWSIGIGMSQWGQLGQVQAEVNKYKGKGVFQL